MNETRRVVEGQAAARVAEAAWVEGAWSARMNGLVVVSLGFSEFWSNVALALWRLDDPIVALEHAADSLAPKPMCVQVVDGATPEIERAALARGMRSRENFFGFARPATDPGLGSPPGYRIEHVRDAESLNDYVLTQSEGFGDDLEMNRARHPERMLADNRIHMFVARDAAGEPVATARAFIDAAAVGISGVTTLPAHRGKGLASALVATAIRAGISAGANLAWLCAGENVAQVYERLGFKRVTALRMFMPG